MWERRVYFVRSGVRLSYYADVGQRGLLLWEDRLYARGNWLEGVMARKGEKEGWVEWNWAPYVDMELRGILLLAIIDVPVQYY